MHYLNGLRKSISNQNTRVGIVGLGYVGLPLALAFSEAGFKVCGVDVQKERVDSVNRGEPYIAGINSKSLLTMVTNRLLEATTARRRLKESDAIYIFVPTPLTKTKEPDLSYVIRESEEIFKYLQLRQLVVLESTTYPGTISEVILPILERSGLKGGRDFYLAYSSERIDPGSKIYSIKNTPKVVGGIIRHDPR